MKTVIDFGTFYKQAVALLGEEGYADFIVFIANHPEAGNVISGTGGFRKVRFARPGKGKRGGVRVIYFYIPEEVTLVLIYAKNTSETLTSAQKAMLYHLAHEFKGE